MENTEEKTDTKGKDQFQFSVDWHLKHAQNWQQIFECYRPKRAIEIGCYEGMSTVFMLDKASWLKELICMDTWEGGIEHTGRDFKPIESRFDHNMRVHPKGGIIKKMKGDSQESLLKLLSDGERESFDFIYIDGNHTAAGTLNDAVLCWKLLKMEGIMVFDDYLWRAIPTNHTLHSPKIAIDAFTTIYSNELCVIPKFHAYQIYLQKVDIKKWHEEWVKLHPNEHPFIEG